MICEIDEYVIRAVYEFTPSGILCTNHINCRDQLCVNLDTGELIPCGSCLGRLVHRLHHTFSIGLYFPDSGMLFCPHATMRVP